MSKKVEIKKLIMHIGNYLSASIFTKFLAFISIPIFTRILGPNGYGGISIFTSVVAIIGILATFGVDTGIRRYCFEQKKDEKTFISSNLLFLFIWQSIILFSVFFFRKWLSIMLSLPIIIIYLATATGILDSYKNIYMAYYQTKQKSKIIRNLSILSGSMVLVLSIILVVITKDYTGKVYGTFISTCIIIFLLKNNIKKLNFRKLDTKLILYSLSIGGPIIFNQLAGYVLTFFDRLVINQYYGLSKTGQYSFAYNVAMLMEVVIHAINVAWVPMMFEKLKDQKNEEINSYLENLLKLVSFVAIGIILFSEEIIYILADSRFYEAVSLVPIIIIGYVFRFFYTVYSNIEYYYKKTKMLAIFTIISGVLNVILNIIFIPRYGYEMAAYTTLASYVILFLLHYFYVHIYISKKIIKFSLFIKNFVFILFGILIYSWINLLNENYIFYFCLKIVLIVLFFITIFMKQMKQIFKK